MLLQPVHSTRKLWMVKSSAVDKSEYTCRETSNVHTVYILIPTLMKNQLIFLLFAPASTGMLSIGEEWFEDTQIVDVLQEVNTAD